MNSSYQPTKEGDFYLYRHIRLDNNQVFYVGIGKKGKSGSWAKEYARAYEKYNRSSFWKRIVEKSGYRVEILLTSDNVSFIKEKEQEFIKLYGRKDLKTGTLCNMTDGGDGMNSPSEEGRKKMSEQCRKNFKGKCGSNSYSAKEVYVYNLDGSFKSKYASFLEAKEILGIKGNVSIARGKYHSTKEAEGKDDNYMKGYLWSLSYLGKTITPYKNVKGRVKGWNHSEETKQLMSKLKLERDKTNKLWQ